jgi:hypothetical protein
MRGFAGIFLIASLMACGGSQDVCQRDLSQVQSQLAFIQNCIPDAGDLSALEDFDGGLQSCEAEIKDCNSSDISTLNSALDCEQSLPSLQCKWFTETDPSTDSSYEQYQTDNQVCQAKANNVTGICASALGSND